MKRGADTVDIERIARQVEDLATLVARNAAETANDRFESLRIALVKCFIEKQR